MPWFFGLHALKSRVPPVAFCENLYQLDGVLGTFSDSFNEVIGKIPMKCHPIAEFGSIKTGLYSTGYDYKDTLVECGPEKFYIADVETSKIRDNNLKERKE